MPKCHHRLVPAPGDGVEMFETLGAPAERGAEHRDEPITGKRDQPRFDALRR